MLDDNQPSVSNSANLDGGFVLYSKSISHHEFVSLSMFPRLDAMVDLMVEVVTGGGCGRREEGARGWNCLHNCIPYDVFR